MANGHGGKRAGAGRKPGQIAKAMVQAGTLPAVTKVTAGEILATQNEYTLWARHLNSKDKRVALDALKYLTDRRDGRAPVQQDPQGRGKMNPADDPRFRELMAKMRPKSVTVTQATITAEEQPELPAAPTIEHRLT